MEQRKLYKTIENFSKQAPNFETTEEFLCYVMNQIINYENIDIIGGRLWKLSDDKKYYKLVEQMGDVQKIDPGYKLKVEKNPYFFLIGKRRSIMASETDFYLKKKGIRLYSATGVGERYKIKKDNEILFLFKYLIAFNGKKIDEELLNTLNIVSTTLSYILRAKKIESSIKENIVELEKASDIQKSILPEHALEFGNYEIFGISVPEKIVGGDFFDYIISGDNDKLSVVVADAASKGISAAAQALYVSGALKMGAEYNVSAASLIKKV
ncbi:MAG: serine/threonine-protein phosphatase, partial [Ignavibacteria bacterium]|nr:serine/threonine-protein phosphatase [Ignavibacteria bacterium]